MKNIYEIYGHLKSKKISSLELTQSCLDQALSGKNNSYITVTADLAIEQARQSDERRAKGSELSPWDGIPYSLKDLFVTKGIRTTAGSKMLYNYIPPYDGFVSSQFKGSGAVLVGKVGCDEFGMGSTNENTIFGPTLNPLNTDYVAGGSSGGSASSVAEKSCYLSMGTDTGGSVRLPANFCGLYGLKPSYGQISRYGQIAYASSLDQASPMGNSVLDLAMAFDLLAKRDDRDSTNFPVASSSALKELLSLPEKCLLNKKIGFSPEFLDSCEPFVKSELTMALDLLKRAGCELIEISLPNLKYSVAVYYIIATSEASSNLARYDGIHFGYRHTHSSDLNETYIASRSFGFGDEVKTRILLGTFALSSGYHDEFYNKACRVRRLIANDFKQVYQHCDFIFSPVCATTALPLGEGLKDPFKMYMNDLFTIPVNLAGLPSVAIPTKGKQANGIPTGFQLIGQSFKDIELLKVAYAIEKEMA